MYGILFDILKQIFLSPTHPRSFSHNQLIKYYTYGPYITFITILTFLKRLRSHINRRANIISFVFIKLSCFDSKSKISYSNFVLLQKDILRLQISMDYSCSIYVKKTFHNLLHIMNDFFFLQNSLIFQNSSQIVLTYLAHYISSMIQIVDVISFKNILKI